MAVVNIRSTHSPVSKLIYYVTCPEKTGQKELVSSFGCHIETAARQMTETKRRYGKEDGIQAYHIVQSFLPGEVTPELAHEIGNRFIREYLEAYETVIGTHVDKEHIHNHIVFNSVSDDTGKKYHPNSYLSEIRAVSNRICEEYGLCETAHNSSRRLNAMECRLHRAGLLTYRDMFEKVSREALAAAIDTENFYELMEERGYKADRTGLFPVFVPYGTKFAYRFKTDGKILNEEDIRVQIENGLETPGPVLLRERQIAVPEPAEGQVGFRALYVSWMYVLGIVGKGGASPCPKVSYSEIKRFEQYQKQAAFLEANGIETAGQLAEKMQSVSDRMESLKKARSDLYTRREMRRRAFDALATEEKLSYVPALYAKGYTCLKKEYVRLGRAARLLADADREALIKERAEINGKIARINSELRRLRSETHLCEQVKKDIPVIKEKLRSGTVRGHRDHFDRGGPSFSV